MPSTPATPSLTRDLVASGYSYDELARLTRGGQLVHLRRGAYAWFESDHPGFQGAERHRQLVLATLPLMTRGGVVSHASAAVLHGLPVWSDRLGRVQITQMDASSGRRRGYLRVHTAPLDRLEVVDLAGVPVTSLGRTVIDLGRVLPFDQAVAAADAALSAGCPLDELAAVLQRSRGKAGVPAARRVVSFSDGRSESSGESLSRMALARLGLPAPTLQYEVLDETGLVVGRADFCWEEQRTLGEFDGKVKYGRLLRPGEAAQDVVYAEKRREDALRDLGWQVVRWSWSDLKDGRTLSSRLQRAFRRGVLG